MELDENSRENDASELNEAQAAPKSEEGSAKKPEKEPLNPGYEAFTVLQEIVGILAVVTIIFVFLVRLVGVDGSSMVPTLYNRDYLLLESNFLSHEVKQGDIVVLNVPAFADRGPIVKRVIATGGQTVDIDFDAGIVYVDGKALSEPYTFEPTYRSFEENGEGLTYPVKVPEGSVFVMGDNRNNSADSRYAPVGTVDESRILGKVLIILFPGVQTDQYGEVTGNRDFSRIGAVS
jgi:signal peptidase I